MNNDSIIKAVSGKKSDQLYDSASVCFYCKTPFTECDTIIPGLGLICGQINVFEYQNRFWHYGCIFDYKKDIAINKLTIS